MLADRAHASVAPGYTPCECAASFSHSIATWPHAEANPPSFSPLSSTLLPDMYDYGPGLHEPRIACWLSRDPIGEEGGFDLYTIVGNSTLSLVDPVGLVCDRERDAVLDARNRLDAVAAVAASGLTSSDILDVISDMESERTTVDRERRRKAAVLALVEARIRTATRAGVPPSDPSIVALNADRQNLLGEVWALQTSVSVLQSQLAALRATYRTAATLPGALANATSAYDNAKRAWTGCMDRERRRGYNQDRLCAFAECIGLPPALVRDQVVEAAVPQGVAEAAASGTMSLSRAAMIARTISRSSNAALVVTIITCAGLSF